MDSIQFIDIDVSTALIFFLVGFVGGMVSGLIGSGGAFVLTPAMMSMGVAGVVAVASNMAHKLSQGPGWCLQTQQVWSQVDVKLGVIMGIFGEAGVLFGKHVMVEIRDAFGAAGTSLHVSFVFAVGGFIGVPAMMYVLGLPALMASATELVIAFVMGLGGSFFYALDGFVDIRLSMLILAGSLFGIQIGAIGTTYVKDYVVKFVIAAIMVLVLVSRFFYIPG